MDNDEEERDEEMVSYRGDIEKEEWDEFKSNVPHSKTLMGQVNELIYEFNESNRKTKSPDDNNANT